jgi:hypothetical protein
MEWLTVLIVLAVLQLFVIEIKSFGVPFDRGSHAPYQERCVTTLSVPMRIIIWGL